MRHDLHATLPALTIDLSLLIRFLVDLSTHLCTVTIYTDQWLLLVDSSIIHTYDARIRWWRPATDTHDSSNLFRCWNYYVWLLFICKVSSLTFVHSSNDKSHWMIENQCIKNLTGTCAASQLQNLCKIQRMTTTRAASLKGKLKLDGCSYFLLHFFYSQRKLIVLIRLYTIVN